MTLTSPSIWICLTGESRVPAVEAISAVDAELDSLREDMRTSPRQTKMGKEIEDARFRYKCTGYTVRVETKQSAPSTASC